MSDDEVTLLWPDRPMCHDHDPLAQRFEPAAWRPAGKVLHPDNDHIPAFRTCSFCGCIHPEDLYSALLAGAKMSGSDWKYGWPHKFYVDNVPNSNVGNLVTTVSGTVGPDEDRETYGRSYIREGGMIEWTQMEPPRTGWAFRVRNLDGAKTHAKWYNTHLHDLCDVAFSAMAEALMKHTNIRFYKQDGKLMYMAPRLGYQKV